MSDFDLTDYKKVSKNILTPKKESKKKDTKLSLHKKEKKKKTGRPTIFSKVAERQISFLVTKEDYESIKKGAGGIPVANYVRQIIFKEIGLDK